MQNISSDLTDMRDRYTVVVIGSGYGGSIAANRLSRAGQDVCLLERGREIVPGEYPDTLSEASQATQLDTEAGVLGAEDGLFRFSVHDDISVLSGNGLGGTSLINANVALPPEPRVFDDPRWPAALREDLDTLLGEAMDRAREMLRPTPYPEDWPRLAKLEALEACASHLDEPLSRPPINVNFEDFDDDTNHVGVEQHPCTLCGDCVSGCNYGAKNTLLMNYLPDAKRHGAEIFCNVEVRHVEREDDSAWTVHFRPLDLGREAFGAQDPFVRADVVVLSAGALGSTEILLRSRREGLALSDRLGESFTGNGDVLGLSYNSDVPVHGVGYGSEEPQGRPPVGPCITGVVDVRHRPELAEGLVIEEGVIPGALASFLPEILSTAGRTIGRDTDQGIADLAAETGRELESLTRGPYHGAVDHTQTFLVMTHDDAAGRMELDEDRLTIRWPGVGDQEAFHRTNADLYRATDALGGTYLRNPLWTRLTGRDLVTVHPLGGCAMAEDATRGVTDDRGRVFDGTGGNDVHGGLYVADGAIIPCSVGVNPLLTISGLAERNVALLAAEHGWSIDYELDDTPLHAEEPTTPGIRFTETMRGRLSPDVTEDLAELAVARAERLPGLLETIEETGQPFDFTLTIASGDVEAMISDPSHRARAAGTVEAPDLHPETLTVTNGALELLSPHPERPDVRRMVYRLRLTSEDGDAYDFEGLKILRDDPGLDTWTDTTTLYVSVRQDDGEPVGRGVLRIEARDFLRQMRTMEITGADGPVERLTWQAQFGRLFAGELFDTYGPIADQPSVFDPDAPPRKRRELRLDAPSVHPVTTPDGTRLRLTRYQGGTKGPVLLVHGLGVSSRIFTLDTIDTNLAEALCASGYDVWLLDWRASIDLPSSKARWNLDAAAADLPAAVDRVRDVTGVEEIDAVVHCVGSLAFHLALLRGMDGIRSLVASQVTLDPVTAAIGKWKAGLYLPDVLDALGVDSLTAYVDTESGWSDRLFDFVLEGQPIEPEERCDSLACRRGTFMYGMLWEHDQLNTATHDTIHEWLGVANIDVFDHLADMARAQRLVDAEGDDANLRNLGRLALPTTYIHGAENAVFVAEGTERSLARLREANPEVSYARHVIPDYGHLDPIIGADAAQDVYPLVLRHLEAVARRQATSQPQGTRRC